MGIDGKLIRDYITDFKEKKAAGRGIVPESVELPIVWFGDSEAYFSGKTRRRLVTVGLNPSYKEFGAGRFAPVDLDAEDAVNQLAAALGGYFKGNPYWQWFRHPGGSWRRWAGAMKRGRAGRCTSICSVPLPRTPHGAR